MTEIQLLDDAVALTLAKHVAAVEAGNTILANQLIKTLDWLMTKAGLLRKAAVYPEVGDYRVTYRTTNRCWTVVCKTKTEWVDQVMWNPGSIARTVFPR